METFILWVSFIGAWLLFAGPIYQAALELQDEDIEIDRIRATGEKVPKPARTSAWLWLLPPLKIYMDHRRNEDHKREIIKLLTKEDLEALASFRSKATGWLFVASGGFCIALKETYELTNHEDWKPEVILVLVILMFILSLVNLVVMLNRGKIIPKS